MLTVSQLSDIFFVLLTLQLLYKRVFFEIKNKASVVDRLFRIVLESYLPFMVFLAGSVLVTAPNAPYPENWFVNVAMQLFDVVAVCASSSWLAIEIYNFYEKYDLENPKLRWVIISQVVSAVGIVLLILR